ELREAAMTWFSSRAYSPYPSSDSVNLILNGLGTGMFVTYEPSALTYSSLKASGDLGIIQNPALRDTIVYYYEDRQPVLLDNNAKAVEAELAWRESLAPHVRTTPASSLRRYPELRVDAPSRLFDDRMLRHRSILMGHLFSFQASNARAMQRINERLRAAIRRELDDGQATG
ncbi:MAG: hypothetical protein PVJ43_09120, partial [Gemmatimonadales bacterium]